MGRMEWVRALPPELQTGVKNRKGKEKSCFEFSGNIQVLWLDE